jgi:hypothetical protein
MSLLDTASLVVTPNGTKAGKLYSVVPSDGAGDLSVTRATTATRVNSSGLIESVASNIPRLDYTNGTCPSILVEPQRTNLNTYSNDFSGVGGWASSGGTITATANYGISPDGTQNSTRLQFSGANMIWRKTISGLTGNVGTWSLYIKGTAGETINITYGGVDINVTLLSGWNRYSITATGTFDEVFINTFSSSTARNIEVWGGQCEAGSYATSYIPTTSASVTRNADVISKTGISSLIGQTEGTVFVDIDLTIKNEDTNPVVSILALNNNVTNVNNAIVVGVDRPSSGTVNQIYAYVVNGGTEQVVLNTSAITNGKYKIAFAYKQNDFALYVNGILIATDTSGNVPTCTQVLLGERFNSDSFKLADNINTSALWKTRLTNTQLAQLTTI